MSDSTQSFANHAKLVPLFHFVAFPLVMVPTVFAGYHLVSDFSVGALLNVAFGVGVLIVAFFARLFPLGVQDRVIRLEEQLRMERILDPDLKARIGEVSTEAMIGLRFAPDDELPGLVRKVLDGSLTDRKAIKQAVKNWRADGQRI